MRNYIMNPINDPKNTQLAEIWEAIEQLDELLTSAAVDKLTDAELAEIYKKLSEVREMVTARLP